MKVSQAIVLVAVIGVSAGHSLAVNIDINAQGYAHNQALEGTSIGIATFTSETGNLIYFNKASTGQGFTANSAGTADITVVFSAPVSNLFVEAGDEGGDNDAFAVSLFAFGTDAFLGTFSSPLFNTMGDPDNFNFNVGGANIGRIVFDPGNSGSLPGSSTGSGGILLRQLTFDVSSAIVPEPASFGLLALGMALIGARRRRAA